MLAAIIIFFAFFLLLFITNYLHTHLKWKSENSRKFLHVSGGLLALISFQFLRTHWLVLFLCSGAFLILLITFLKKTMPSVHETHRVSFGSILFPIPIYLCFLAANRLDNQLLFYLPISLMTIADPLAEWGGKKWEKRSIAFFHGQKTLAGSVCFAVSSFAICLLFFAALRSQSLQELWLFSLIIMLVSTITELLTLKGFDNLTVPLVALGVLYLLC